MIEIKDYQERAIAKLKDQVNELLNRDSRETVVFKSPTGSGKTLMVAEFIRKVVDRRDDEKMNLKEAEQHAKNLIRKYCPEYKFKYNNKKRALGTCNYKTKTIYLSKTYTEMNKEHIIINTILHEIAHALTPYNNHGYKWKLKAQEIGCNAQIYCNDSLLKVPRGKYKYICINCNKIYYFYKKIKRAYACAHCCKIHTKGKYDERFTLKNVMEE